MRFLLILYITLTFSTALAQTYGFLPQDAGQSFAGVDANVQDTLAAQSQAYTNADKASIGLTQLMHSYLSVIAQFTTFSFTIGDAPAPLNYFLRSIFGLFSILFWGSIMKQLISLIPFVGS